MPSACKPPATALLRCYTSGRYICNRLCPAVPSDRRLIKPSKIKSQRLMEAHLAPKKPIQVNKITSSYEICSGPHKHHTLGKGKRIFKLGTTLNSSTSTQKGSFSTYSSSYQAKLERTLSEFDSHQERRLSSLGAQLGRQQDDMINKINILWKVFSKKLDNTSTHDTAGDSMAHVEEESEDEFEEEIKEEEEDEEEDKRELFQDLAPLLWNSFGTIAALLQSVGVYLDVVSFLRYCDVNYIDLQICYLYDVFLVHDVFMTKSCRALLLLKSAGNKSKVKKEGELNAIWDVAQRILHVKSLAECVMSDCLLFFKGSTKPFYVRVMWPEL
ncbi:MAK10-like protein [Tanacetum coccineum]